MQSLFIQTILCTPVGFCFNVFVWFCSSGLFFFFFFNSFLGCLLASFQSFPNLFV